MVTDFTGAEVDIIRVLRVIEYVGPRNQVEEQIDKSIHGQRKVHDVTIRVATIGTFPEILDAVYTSPYHKNQLPGFSSDPVHQVSIDDGWSFWDETWTSRIGPYPTEAAARVGLAKYCEQLNRVDDASNSKAVEATDQPEPYFKS